MLKKSRKESEPTYAVTNHDHRTVRSICTVCLYAVNDIYIYIITEFIYRMITRQPMAQALRTCVSSFIEYFPFMFAEAAAITLVSFLMWSVI